MDRMLLGRGVIVVPLAAVVMAVTMWLQPAPVSAHTFLVQSSPQAGERLDASPRLLDLQFTEAVAAPSSDQVTIKGTDGQTVRLGRLLRSVDGTALSVALPHLSAGGYIISWQVVSADDGHLSAGDFAFAVGAGAALPTLAGGASASTDWPQVIAGWLLVLGLATGLGGLASEVFIWTPLLRGHATLAAPVADSIVALPTQAGLEREDSADSASGSTPRTATIDAPALTHVRESPPAAPIQATSDSTWALPQAPTWLALVVALVGAGSAFVLVAGRLGGGAVLGGFAPRAWLEAVQTPVGVLALGGFSCRSTRWSA